MHTKIEKHRQMKALEHVLDALAQELIQSTDEELLQAARDLGMDPAMRGSAAFIGLKYPSLPQPSDFFDVVTRDPAQIKIGPPPFDPKDD
jgi:hypothetical protein